MSKSVAGAKEADGQTDSHNVETQSEGTCHSKRKHVLTEKM